MAVFPDKIGLKNSTDDSSAILGAISPGGSEPIVPGELVISRSNGSASLYTLDANNSVVKVGTEGAEAASLDAYIIQNFDNVSTETAFSTDSMFVPVPDTGDPKFGTGAVLFDHNSDLTNFAQNVAFAGDRLPGALGTSQFTLEFWIKTDIANWYRTLNGAGGLGPQGFMSIVGYKGFPQGLGALNVYMDAGTLNNIGYGTTSRSDVAQGAICLGLWPGEDRGAQSIAGLPSTGEILCSGTVSVADNVYHHVLIQHEGSGSYSMYIDGAQVDRVRLSESLTFGVSEPSDTAVVGPYDLYIGGQSSDVLGTGQSGDFVNSYGFNGLIDSFRIVRTSLYPSWGTIPVPTGSAATPVLVPLPSLKSLSDTAISLSPANNSVLQYDSSTETWYDAAVPGYDLSGNNLDDINDVTISNVATGQYLKWDGSAWVNDSVDLGDLSNVAPGIPAIGDFLVWNGSTYERNASTVCIVSATEPTTRPGTTLIRDGDQWLDSSTGEFYVRNNGVFELTAGGGGATPGGGSIDDLTDVDTTTVPPNSGDTLAWNSGLQIWEPVAQPPANISTSSIHQLADVEALDIASRVDGNVLKWVGGSNVYALGSVNYAEIEGTTQISKFQNDVGYLVDITSQKLEDLVNVVGNPPYQMGDILIYNTNLNLYEYKQNNWLRYTDVSDTPNDGDAITYNSALGKWVAGSGGGGGATNLDGLSDVSKDANDDIVFQDANSLTLDDAAAVTYGKFKLGYGDTSTGAVIGEQFGLTLKKDGLPDASEIWLSRSYGTKMVLGGTRSPEDNGMVLRLQGQEQERIDSNNNCRPVVRWESGDYTYLNETGNYISLSIPNGLTENTDYVFPPEDGSDGYSLRTDGQGRTYWAPATGVLNGGVWVIDAANTTPNFANGEFNFDNNDFGFATEIRLSIITSDNANVARFMAQMGRNNGIISVQEVNQNETHLFRITSAINDMGSLIYVFGIELIESTSGQLMSSIGETCEIRFFPSSSRLSDAIDVSSNTPTDGSVLVYNATTGEYAPGSAPATGVGRGEGGNFETGSSLIPFASGIYGGGDFETGVADLPIEQTTGVDGGVFT